MTPDRCWSFIAGKQLLIDAVSFEPITNDVCVAGGRDSGIKLTNTIAAAKKRKCNEDLKQCTVPMKNGKVVPGYVRDFDFAAPKAL